MQPIIVLELGQPPKSGNHLFKSDWQTNHGYRRKWQKKVAQAFMVARTKLEGDPPRQFEDEKWKVRAVWIARNPPRDTHPNCCIALKPIIDACVGEAAPAPLLYDDDDEHLIIEIDKRRALKGEAESLTLEFYRMAQDGAFDWR